MNRHQATQMAAAEAPKFGIPPGATPSDPEQAWIELPVPPRERTPAPGSPAPRAASTTPAAPFDHSGRFPIAVPVADLLVWLVQFWSGPAWIQLALADTDGRVVRVTRSRNFVLSHGGPGIEYPEQEQRPEQRQEQCPGATP